jgi:hypothetical protein
MLLWLIPKKERDRIETLLDMQIQRGGLAKAKRYVAGGGFAQECEARIAMELLARKDLAAHREWLKTPEGAGTRQARAAEHTAIAAYAALGVSLIALIVSIVALFTDRERQAPMQQSAPTAGASPPSTPAAASRP